MLDNDQLEAVNFYNGACLTLAGPGSGKTTVLVNRIIHLIEVCKARPESILVITFTKDAALEMQSRFMSACKGPDAGLVNFGTFHSIFYRILRAEIGIDNNSIIWGKSLTSFIKEVIKVSNINFDEHMIESLYSEFSYVTNTGGLRCDYEPDAFDKEEFATLYNTYTSMKRAHNKIDFDDMLFYTYEMFTDNPRILKKWQKRYEYYLVDEMQDMNDIQFDIMKLLISSGNVFAVGDDDQSIYGFRGANPDIMRKFSEYYENCRIIRLGRNYRSAPNIVDAASNLISYNKERFDKELSSAGYASGRVRSIEFRDNVSEATWVCNEVKSIVAKDKKTSVSILFRNKNQSLLIMKALTDQGVAYFVKDKADNIYNHWIFKDIMSFLKISLGEYGRADMLRIYNKPNRYILRNCIDRDDVTFADMVSFYKDKPYMVQRINDMKSDIMRLRTMRPASAILYIRKKIGYDSYIREAATGNKKLYEDNVRILENIMSIAIDYKDIRSFLTECNNRLEFANSECDESHARVYLYTFHASKGLEFDNVYILDVNEGITPSKKAEDKKSLEEERRMFYVAITRAKTNLTMCYITRRNNEKLFSSRFIEEMRQARQTSD